MTTRYVHGPQAAQQKATSTSSDDPLPRFDELTPEELDQIQDDGVDAADILDPEMMDWLPLPDGTAGIDQSEPDEYATMPVEELHRRAQEVGMAEYGHLSRQDIEEYLRTT